MKGLLNKVIDAAFSPKAFSTYAVIGVGVTVTMAILNTRKQCKKEFEKKSQEGYLEKELTREDVKEEIKDTIKTYIPTATSALATLFCINKAEQGWVDYSGVLNSAYLASEKRVGQLRSIAPGAVVVAAHNYISNREAQEGMHWYCIPSIGDFPDLYFQTTGERLYYARLNLNRNYYLRYSASLREFLVFLDVLDQFDDDVRKQIDKYGDNFGWDMVALLDDDPSIVPWIEFSLKEGDDGIIYIYANDWLNPPCYSPDMHELAYGYMMHPHE